ncbi:tRNA lysidine(34) synthetase TilS [Sandarakinorhabdus sp.]|uniref:tRNA lysidine(34) synthetase TilS n=1 Tax=Sandarakinorhabdus sp. TaxID=1916663 RepID=UPI0033420F60
MAAAERLAVAVSGGPDSLALLGLAQAAFAGRVTALTVDHRLRAASADEAAAVAAQCAARGIAHVTLLRPGAGFASNVQARARAARYAMLADWCAAHGQGLLLTAHHADDQAETLLMRLDRASGSDGLAGIRPVRQLQPAVLLVRPLLAVRKSSLIAIAGEAGWQVIDDPSNRDPRHDRSRIRTALAASGLAVPALARAAAHLAQDAQALAWAAQLAWDGRVTHGPPGVLLMDVRGLPTALRLRLLARGVSELGPEPGSALPRGGDVARLAARLASGKPGTLAGVCVRAGLIWRLQRAPLRRIGPKSGRNCPNGEAE